MVAPARELDLIPSLSRPQAIEHGENPLDKDPDGPERRKWLKRNLRSEVRIVKTLRFFRFFRSIFDYATQDTQTARNHAFFLNQELPLHATPDDLVSVTISVPGLRKQERMRQKNEEPDYLNVLYDLWKNLSKEKYIPYGKKDSAIKTRDVFVRATMIEAQTVKTRLVLDENTSVLCFHLKPESMDNRASPEVTELLRLGFHLLDHDLVVPANLITINSVDSLKELIAKEKRKKASRQQKGRR